MLSTRPILIFFYCFFHSIIDYIYILCITLYNRYISTPTLNEFCLILNCRPEDIISFEPTEEEIKNINNQIEEINDRKRKHKK
ncbi:MAG: helix-turn-helix domain-containing protein [Lachnospiraceae bacterium]|nr:helix-turn-helix domain-containing protein [Lachnospiraceae bacterium]